MEFLFVWVVLSLMVGIWNKNRGNSFFAGLFFSLFFSPIIGFIIVGVTKKNEKGLEKQALQSGEMKKCPQCAELIRAEAMKCRFCGAELISST